VTERRTVKPETPDTGKVEFPDVFEGDVDNDLLERLIEDLKAHAEILDVRLKGSSDRHSDDTNVLLDAGLMMLQAKAVRGMQVRYRFEDSEWRDTLTRFDDGWWKIIRVRMPW